MAENLNQQIFQYEKNISPFRKLLIEHFSERDVCFVYRTIQDIPTTKDDQRPRILRDRNVGKSIARVYSVEEIDNMPFEKQLRAVGSFGLSVNDSPEAAIDSCLSTYQKLQDKGVPAESLESYKKERGSYVAKFKISTDVGIMTDFYNHHANLYLYDGVDLEDLRVKEFNPIKIEYPPYEKGE